MAGDEPPKPPSKPEMQEKPVHPEVVAALEPKQKPKVTVKQAANLAMGAAWAATLGGTIHALCELPFVVPIEASITQTQLNGKHFFWNVKDLYAKQALYRSLPVTAAGLIPKCVIHYAWLNFYANLLIEDGDIKKGTKTQSAMVGMLTGASEVAFLTPINFVKFRMQRPEWGYKSSADCLRTVYRTEGLFAFWKGTQAIFFRNSICMLGMVGFYNTVEGQMPEHMPFRRLAAGAICGIIGSFMSYPFEMLRAARQHNVSFYNEMASKGFKRLMAGYVPGACRIVLHSMALGVIMPNLNNMAKASWYKEMFSHYTGRSKKTE